jgi:hypothetical protein
LPERGRYQLDFGPRLLAARVLRGFGVLSARLWRVLARQYNCGAIVTIYYKLGLQN